VLRVAQRLLDRGVVDRDLRAAAVLPPLFAALADRHRDLILRAAGRVARARRGIERDIAQSCNQVVVIDAMTTIVATVERRIIVPSSLRAGFS
jgi:hypothetical protein